ncbi:unnamed protein product, partial [Thlaspi arvense]
MGEFQECLDTSSFFYLTFRGCRYRWTNSNPINAKARKLDRTLINKSWEEKYPDSYAYFGPPGSADHSPCLISLNNEVRMRKTRFIYFSSNTLNVVVLCHPIKSDVLVVSKIEKSRVRWLTNGDANTGNVIHFLRDKDDRKISDLVLIKAMAVSYYEDLLAAINSNVVALTCNQIQTRPFLACQVRLGNLALVSSSVGWEMNVTKREASNHCPFPSLFTYNCIDNLVFHLRLLFVEESVGNPPEIFSSSKTWVSLHPSPPTVSWFKSVWFKYRIPKHAFFAWVTIQDRLPTRDRLRSWGLNVPPGCLLCSTGTENRSHLFFGCSFSSVVLASFFTHRDLSPPSLLEDIVQWTQSSSRNSKLKMISKLLFQAVIYALWKERNARLHTSISRPPLVVVKDILITLRVKLLGLDRKESPFASAAPLPSSSLVMETFLHTWCRYIQL